MKRDFLEKILSTFQVAILRQHRATVIIYKMNILRHNSLGFWGNLSLTMEHSFKFNDGRRISVRHDQAPKNIARVRNCPDITI